MFSTSSSSGGSATSAPRTDLVATLSDAAQLAQLGQRSARSASWLEVRADLVGELDVEEVRRQFDGELLFTLRSAEEGGLCKRPPAQRRELLVRAAERFDLIDLEISRDLEAAESIPEEKRLLSWHDAADRRTSDQELEAVFARSLQTAARFRKLIPSAREPVDALVPLRFLAKTRRSDVTCFATGEAASWARIVAPRLGSVFTYGALGEAVAPGQFRLRDLVEDYGLPRLRQVDRFYGIVGDPVSSSLSPRMHNGAYLDLGLDACYLAFQAPAFGRFWLDIVESPVFEWLGAPLQALSVTAPHKSAALALAGASSPRAQAIDSANTLLLRDQVWQAESTDPEGVSLSVARRRGDLSSVSPGDPAPALVLGSGGAGRAAVLGLRQLGYEVSLSNRTVESGERVAQRLGVQHLPRSAVRESDFEVVVNATSLGRKEGDRLPLEPRRCRKGALVVDMVYGAQPTPLERACARAEIQYVSGREVLLMQAVEQFSLMTGKQLPLASTARRIGLSGDFDGAAGSGALPSGALEIEGSS